MTNISKLLPACGFAIAVALVAVTSAFKEAPRTKGGDTMYTFEYNASGGTDYSATSVEKASNWSYTSDDSRCTDVNNKACRIYVTEDYVDNPSSAPALDPSIDIVAAAGTGSNAYVSKFYGSG